MNRLTRIGGSLVGIGAGAVALLWLLKDRLSGPATTPVRTGDAPGFRVAPPSAGTPSAAADDLGEVKGIGPVYRARLAEAGIETFAGLSAASAESVAEAAGVPAERATDWIDQARGLQD